MRVVFLSPENSTSSTMDNNALEDWHEATEKIHSMHRLFQHDKLTSCSLLNIQGNKSTKMFVYMTGGVACFIQWKCAIRTLPPGGGGLQNGNLLSQRQQGSIFPCKLIMVESKTIFKRNNLMLSLYFVKANICKIYLKSVVKMCDIYEFSFCFGSNQGT